MPQLVHELITEAARRTPQGLALRYLDNSLAYAELAQGVEVAAQGLLALGLERGERVAIFLDKCEEAVLAMFGAAAAGLVFVPVNPLLKAGQVGHVLRDSGARVLLTSPGRLAALELELAQCPGLRCVLQTGREDGMLPGLGVLGWDGWLRRAAAGPARAAHRRIESDIAALLYTSGGSGAPKGVVLSHRNLVAGAASVSGELGHTAQDRILALLPFSLAYGLSQLTGAFAAGAAVVLMNPLLTRDIPALAARERITGLAALPPLWIQLAELHWEAAGSLRYLTSSGGTLPRATLDALRRRLPQARMYLMFGMTEAFRSTCLTPEQRALRPDSIGKAIANAEVLVLRPDGQPCAPGEPGELVHRGPLVALGYWNDAARSAERFRPLPSRDGAPLAELALWTGDTVRIDEEGYLYFLGRSDETIKTGGYRVSPSEIEDVLYATGLVEEAAALGLDHPVLGQSIALAVTARSGCPLEPAALLAACRAKLPAYMMPLLAQVRAAALPRSPNGKFDRRLLAAQMAGAA
ncbi:acyl-CoA ligase (AMP-forming), exosortase A system-associated [Massilia atriviolacea]|uniref:Acyl-CoA ligase (AMP-forming), exosortase A system-associated n=1 Tax=Massilia atriviolacea TaxID=2495579 RepID=A0A430HTF1_9BURK|nr:acyl-CoA ligase (AMP-forming), exosortase A system-associated [Massilia atriviolacea]RSZ60811.1 acyl-CoA ligase (AMP-forming), exosortase A system-associated [Massilia atriviolacea]